MMTHPRIYRAAARSGGWMTRYPALLKLVPPLRAWLSERTLPPIAEKSFTELWKARAKKS
jgi:hypothetical protein